MYMYLGKIDWDADAQRPAGSRTTPIRRVPCGAGLIMVSSAHIRELSAQDKYSHIDLSGMRGVKDTVKL